MIDERELLQNIYDKGGRDTYPILELSSDTQELLEDLERRGLIKIEAHFYSRTIQLTIAGRRYVENNFQLQEPSNNQNITFSIGNINAPSIGNINAPSIIGTQQQNATLNARDTYINFDKIKDLIASAPIEDRQLLNELTETVESTMQQNRPFERGMLSRFGDVLAKNQEIAVAIWGTIHCYLTNIFN